MCLLLEGKGRKIGQNGNRIWVWKAKSGWRYPKQKIVFICYVLSLVEDAICQSRCRIIWSTLKKELIIVKKGYKKSQQNPKNPHETPFWLTSFFVWKACSKLELAKN